MAQRNEDRHEIYDVNEEDIDVLETSIAACHVMETQAVTTRDNNEAMHQQPTLPNGQVIDSKNTLQSFMVPIPTTLAVANTGSNIANAADVTSASNTGNNAGQASSIVEGVLVANDESPSTSGRTKSFWCGVMITLGIVCAIAVMGVCNSGKCSAAKNDPTTAKSGQSITDIPTSSPTILNP